MYSGYHTLKEMVLLKKGAPSSHSLNSPQPFTSYLHSSLQNMKYVKMQCECAQIQSLKEEKQNPRSVTPHRLYTLKIQAEGNHAKHLCAISNSAETY